ncbi:MAG: hypothetical protein IJF59_05480 [Clostridia bacterium]|nr:hypothetical protein [Clostridia bacterium]
MPTFLLPAPSFDLDKIADSGQVFRWRRLGAGRFLLCTADRAALAVQEGETLQLTCPEESLPFWRHYLDLDGDGAACWAVLRAWAQVDGEAAFLSRAVAAAEGVRVLRQPLFETVIAFLVSQNNNIGRITSILNAMTARLGGPCRDGAALVPLALPRAFPTPAALAAEGALEGLRLGYRERYVREAARRFAEDPALEGHLLSLPPAEAREQLLAFDGIGPKVADCIALFALGQRDAFPRDVWIRRALAQQFPDGFPSERYEGFLGLVQQVLFYSMRAFHGHGGR